VSRRTASAIPQMKLAMEYEGDALFFFSDEDIGRFPHVGVFELSIYFLTISIGAPLQLPEK